MFWLARKQKGFAEVIEHAYKVLLCYFSWKLPSCRNAYSSMFFDNGTVLPEFISTFAVSIHSSICDKSREL
jgi:hypothetical protein